MAIELRTLKLLLIALSLSPILTTIAAQELSLQWRDVGRSSSNTHLHAVDTDSGKQCIVSVANSTYVVVDAYVPGQQLVLQGIWEYYSGSASDGIHALTVYNTDEDIQDEIIIFTASGHLYEIDSKEMTSQRFEQLHYRHVRSMAIGDYDQDDSFEMICMKDDAGHPSYQLMILDYQTLDTVYLSPVLAGRFFMIDDTDTNGFSEVYFGRDSLMVFDFLDRSITTLLDRRCNTYAIEDFNGDGSQEICITDHLGLYRYSWPGLSLQSFRPGQYTSANSILPVNINADTEQELFIISDHKLECYRVFDDEESYSFQASDIESIVLTDIDSDAKIEILHSDNSYNSGESHIYIRSMTTGNHEWNSTTYSGLAHVLVGQYDPDAGLEISTLFTEAHKDFENLGGLYISADYPSRNVRLRNGLNDIMESHIDMAAARLFANSTHDQVAYLSFTGFSANGDLRFHLIDNHKEVYSEIIGMTSYATIEIGNLDVDSDKEILIVQNREMQVYNLVNQQLSLDRTHTYPTTIENLKLIDLDGDQIDEIIFHRELSEEMSVLDALTFEILFLEENFNVLDYACGDLDGDGSKDLLCFCDNTDQFVIYDPLTFEILRKVRIPGLEAVDHPQLALYDLEVALPGDEIFLVNDRVQVIHLDITSPVIASGAPFRQSSLISDITILDADNDGRKDFFFGHFSGLMHYEYKASAPNSIMADINRHVCRNTITARTEGDCLVLHGAIEENATIRIFNSGGQLVHTLVYSQPSIFCTQGIESLIPGMYFVSLSQHHCTETIRLFKT